MEVTENLLNWLKKSNVLKNNSIQENNKFYIHEDDAQAFENGLRFVPLITRVLRSGSLSDRCQTPVPEIKSLKDTNSTAAKLYNWNILIKALETIHISVDSDMKALIVAGDRPIVADILKSIYEADQGKAEIVQLDETKKKKRKLLGEGALLLDELDPNSSLMASENTLEFLILTLCKAFSLNSKTAAGLLMQNGKFLTQILQKGLKGKVEPVLSWYSMISENSGFLADLLTKEKNSFIFVLNSLKGGIAAKDFSIVQKTCTALVSICSSPQCLELETWTWFASEVYSKAFAAYNTFKEDVTTFILNLLITLGRHNLKEAFGQMIVSLYPDPSTSFSVISSFWGYIDEDSQAYQDIQSQGLVNYWIDFGLRETENYSNVNSKVAALGFLCDVWLKYDKFIEQHEDLANCILTVIKRACREKSKILKVICFGRLFLLLSLFSKKKNSYAAILYKTLTFALVENYAVDRMREFLLNNFLIVLQEIQNLPVGILIEPYVKQTQTSSKRQYSTADFDFYVALARHPRLSVKDAIILADSLGKVYFNDFLYSTSAEIPLVLIFGRFLDTRPMQEFVAKLLELGLKLIYSKLKSKPKIPVKETLTKEEQEEEKQLNYFKRLLCSLSEKVVHLDNPEMNKEIKEILIIGCVEIKKISGSNIRGIRSVLDLLGDSNSLIYNYEMDKNAIVCITEQSNSRNSRNSSRVVSVSNSSQVRHLNGSRPRDRAQSDIERVKQLRLDREHQEKSRSEKKRLGEERQKKILRSQLEQRKILLGKNESSEALVVKELSTVIDLPFYSVEEETRPDQDMIFTALKKFNRVFRTLFNHYSSSGYKIDNFAVKQTFENLQDKRGSISEGELVKLLREQCISNSLITTEEVRKIIAWMLQRLKLKVVEFENFPLLLFYISQFIYTRSPFSYNHFPSAVCLLALMDQFMKSSSKVVPGSYYKEPDFGVGDKEIIQTLNKQLINDPTLELPEGYRKVQEKDLKVEFKVPKNLNIKKAVKVSLEVLDSILFGAFQVHLLSPVVSVVSITTVKGFLNRPQIEAEDKRSRNMKDSGIPSNRASYKVQPLPTYMNFSPCIKLEVTRLTGRYSNEMLMECARLVDDLLYTVNSGSFEIISRNPKPAGSITNKVTQLKLQEEAFQVAEKEKLDLRRKIRRDVLTQELDRLRNAKKAKEIEEEAKNMQEKNKEEQEKRTKLEKKTREKEEMERKIREFKLKKEEDELQKLNKDNQAKTQLEERKKKEREEFLRQAKKKLLDEMIKKKEKKQENKEEPKKELRKTLIQKLTRNKTKLFKEPPKTDLAAVMSDHKVTSIFNLYHKSLEATFTYFCKLMPLNPSDTSLLSLPAYSKLVTTFKIVPGLTTIDESVRVFKVTLKNNNGEAGISLREFKEIIVHFALNCNGNIEKKNGRKMESYSECLTEFFSFIDMPVEPKRVLDVIRGVKN